jgi:hypothetical protein
MTAACMARFVGAPGGVKVFGRFQRRSRGSAMAQPLESTFDRRIFLITRHSRPARLYNIEQTHWRFGAHARYSALRPGLRERRVLAAARQGERQESRVSPALRIPDSPRPASSTCWGGAPASLNVRGSALSASHREEGRASRSAHNDRLARSLYTGRRSPVRPLAAVRKALG